MFDDSPSLDRDPVQIPDGGAARAVDADEIAFDHVCRGSSPVMLMPLPVVFPEMMLPARLSILKSRVSSFSPPMLVDTIPNPISMPEPLGSRTFPGAIRANEVALESIGRTGPGEVYTAGCVARNKISVGKDHNAGKGIALVRFANKVA